MSPDMSPDAARPTPLVRPGVAVYTEDGDHIGTVGAVRAGYFHIGLAFPFGYWLPVDAVDLVTPERVTLMIPHAWLQDCKRTFLPAA